MLVKFDLLILAAQCHFPPTSSTTGAGAVFVNFMLNLASLLLFQMLLLIVLCEPFRTFALPRRNEKSTFKVENYEELKEERKARLR